MYIMYTHTLSQNMIIHLISAAMEEAGRPGFRGCMGPLEPARTAGTACDPEGGGKMGGVEEDEAMDGEQERASFLSALG